MAQSIQAQGGKAVLAAIDILQATQRDELGAPHCAPAGHWLPSARFTWTTGKCKAGWDFYVFTPLQLADSPAVVMVQRGWAPRNFEDRTALPTVQTAE